MFIDWFFKKKQTTTDDLYRNKYSENVILIRLAVGHCEIPLSGGLFQIGIVFIHLRWFWCCPSWKEEEGLRDI